MTAREEREYRAVSRKLVEVEERTKLLEELKRRKVCLGEEERFVQKMKTKFKILGNRVGEVGRQHDEIVSTTLKFKLRDNNQAFPFSSNSTSCTMFNGLKISFLFS